MGDSASGQTGGHAPRRRRPNSPGSSVLTPPTGLPALPDRSARPDRSPGSDASAPFGLGSAIPAQRRPDDDRAVTAPPAAVDPCACGHGRAAHDHYRPGHDCGACGAAGCAEFRPEGGAARRMLRRLGLVP